MHTIPIRHNLVTFINVKKLIKLWLFQFYTVIVDISNINGYIYVKIYHLKSAVFSYGQFFVSAGVHLISVWGMLSSSVLRHG